MGVCLRLTGDKRAWQVREDKGAVSYRIEASGVLQIVLQKPSDVSRLWHEYAPSAWVSVRGERFFDDTSRLLSLDDEDYEPKPESKYEREDPGITREW